MTEKNLKGKTASGLWWGGIGSGVQQLINIFIGIFLARILTQEDYGLVEMLSIFTAIASTTINSGFSVALTNKKNATQRDYDSIFWFMVFMSVLLYVILFSCAPLIARFYDRPELVTLSRVLFIGFLFGGIGTVPYTYMLKKLIVKQRTIINIVALSISGIIGVFCALKGYAYWALVIPNVIYISLNGILHFLISPWRPTFHFSFEPLKEMLPFSIKIFITNIFTQINGHFFSVILGKKYDAEQLGVYSQGNKWAVFGNSFIGGMFNSVAQPVLVEVNEDKERQKGVVRKLIRFGAFISFPFMLGIAFVGKEFIEIAIEERWLSSVPFLQLACVWGSFSFLSALYVSVLYSHGKSDLYMYGTMIIGVLQLLVVISLHSLGIFPMFIALISMNFVGLFIWQFFVQRIIGLSFWTVCKDVFPYLGITIFSFFIAWICTKEFNNVYLLFFGKVLISIAIYVAIMKLSKSVIFQESIDFLFKFRRSI